MSKIQNAIKEFYKQKETKTRFKRRNFERLWRKSF